DGEARVDAVVQEPEEHLRRHACPPYLEPSWMGADENAGRNRACPLSRHRRTVVAVHQPVPRDVGAERLQTGIPAVRRLRDQPPLRAHRRRTRVKNMKKGTKAFFVSFTVLCVQSFAAGQTTPTIV